MAKKQSQKPTKELSFEQAIKQLEEIAQAIEAGKIGLEESVDQYERGMELYQHCRRILDAAEMKVEKLQAQQDGTLTPEPAEDLSDQSE
jgi:exodeoxyribonuclease VII small subunit